MSDSLDLPRVARASFPMLTTPPPEYCDFLLLDNAGGSQTCSQVIDRYSIASDVYVFKQFYSFELPLLL